MGNPHDALFHFIFADLQHAEALLRRLLPPALRQAFANCKITAVPASAAGAHLRQHHADLLFVIDHPDLGQPILLLLEHKSGRDHRLTRQALRYVTNLGPGWANRRGLPPFFVPLVVHHGRRPLGALTWRPAQRKASRVTGLFEALRELDPTLSICAWDLTRCSEAELIAEALTALARLGLLFLQFLPGNDEAACFERLDRWAPLLQEAAAAPRGHLGIDRLHSYILHVTDVPTDRLTAKFAKILNRSPENLMITTAQRLRAEGKSEGKADLLLRLLAAKFGPVSDEATQRIRSATTNELDELGLRLLDATSIADVLGTR